MIESEDIVITKLTDIFRASLANACFPKKWQEVRVIPKPGRLPYSVADAYRPISVISILLKIVEKMMDRFIKDEPLKRKPLHQTLNYQVRW